MDIRSDIIPTVISTNHKNTSYTLVFSGRLGNRKQVKLGSIVLRQFGYPCFSRQWATIGDTIHIILHIDQCTIRVFPTGTQRNNRCGGNCIKCRWICQADCWGQRSVVTGNGESSDGTCSQNLVIHTIGNQLQRILS